LARKLKTYQTSLGFFDLATAAPSMKAALEAWGADSNLFHQAIAKESHDPEIVAATKSSRPLCGERATRRRSERMICPTDTSRLQAVILVRLVREHSRASEAAA
jgi:hypothetical protein